MHQQQRSWLASAGHDPEGHCDAFRLIVRRTLFHRTFNRCGEIGLLPGEAAILVRRAAEMTVGGGAPVDRPVELEGAADVGRRQAEQLRQDLLELLFFHLAGAVGVDQNRHRIGDTDRVGDLDRAALGNAGGHHVLGEIARSVGCRAVDLGRVLAGEGAAAVRRVTAVGVDDDLAPGEAAVAVGTADDEIAGRVDQEV